jgi:hypothetical protein
LKRPEPQEIILAQLPQNLAISRYAWDKAVTINALVQEVHGDSFEWYGFTLGKTALPELVQDIGLPPNNENVLQYTRIDPGNIAGFQETLPSDLLITGWVHSHGNLNHHDFSRIDEENQITVLDYVTSRLRIPVAKKEVSIKDLELLVQGQYQPEDLARGSVSLITDVAVGAARIMETVYGGFCYGLVLDDSGWHKQEIHYKKRGILSGQTVVTKMAVEMVLVETGRLLTAGDLDTLRREVETNLKPITNPPPELIERM